MTNFFELLGRAQNQFFEINYLVSCFIAFFVLLILLNILSIEEVSNFLKLDKEALKIIKQVSLLSFLINMTIFIPEDLYQIKIIDNSPVLQKTDYKVRYDLEVPSFYTLEDYLKEDPKIQLTIKPTKAKTNYFKDISFSDQLSEFKRDLREGKGEIELLSGKKIEYSMLHKNFLFFDKKYDKKSIEFIGTIENSSIFYKLDTIEQPFNQDYVIKSLGSKYLGSQFSSFEDFGGDTFYKNFYTRVDFGDYYWYLLNGPGPHIYSVLSPFIEEDYKKEPTTDNHNITINVVEKGEPTYRGGKDYTPKKSQYKIVYNLETKEIIETIY